MRLVESVLIFVLASAVVVACGDGSKSSRGNLRENPNKRVRNDKLKGQLIKKFEGVWLQEETYNAIFQGASVAECQGLSNPGVYAKEGDRFRNEAVVYYNLLEITNTGKVMVKGDSRGKTKEVAEVSTDQQRFKITKEDDKSPIANLYNGTRTESYVRFSGTNKNVFQAHVDNCLQKITRENRDRLASDEVPDQFENIICELSYEDTQHKIDTFVASRTDSSFDELKGQELKGYPVYLVKGGELSTEFVALAKDINQNGKVDEKERGESREAVMFLAQKLSEAYSNIQGSNSQLSDILAEFPLSDGSAHGGASPLTSVWIEFRDKGYSVGSCNRHGCSGTEFLATVEESQVLSSPIEVEIAGFYAWDENTNKLEEVEVGLTCAAAQ